MAGRVLIAALVGIFAAALIEPIQLALFQLYVIHNNYWFSGPRFWESLERVPGICVLGIIVSSPLIAITLLVGIAFRRSIARHMGLWSLASPLIVWCFVCILDASIRYNPYCETHSFPDRVRVTFAESDNLLFLLGPAASALTFYLLSRQSPCARKRLQRKWAAR